MVFSAAVAFTLPINWYLGVAAVQLSIRQKIFKLVRVVTGNLSHGFSVEEHFILFPPQLY